MDECPEVFDELGYRVWPDGHKTWLGPGPQPDRPGMSLETASLLLKAGLDSLPSRP